MHVSVSGKFFWLARRAVGSVSSSEEAKYIMGGVEATRRGRSRWLAWPGCRLGWKLPQRPAWQEAR